MKNTDFIIKKLNYYLENFDNLTDEEIKQSNYFVLYKANEHIARLTEMAKEVQEQNKMILDQNDHLSCLVLHYRNFIKDSSLTKRFELYSKRKDVI